MDQHFHVGTENDFHFIRENQAADDAVAETGVGDFIAQKKMSLRGVSLGGRGAVGGHQLFPFHFNGVGLRVVRSFFRGALLCGSFCAGSFRSAAWLTDPFWSFVHVSLFAGPALDFGDAVALHRHDDVVEVHLATGAIGQCFTTHAGLRIHHGSVIGERPLENQEIRSRMLEKAKEASQSPGCYLMKEDSGGVIYVGKARNLRNRLQQYFQPAQHENARTELMVSRVRKFEVILTETEAEALILENTLIKKHKPKFNVRLKDDKSYPYLKVDRGSSYPRLEWTRRVQREGARYFGPFPSSGAARQVLRLLNLTFQLRDCSDNTFRHRSRPCILYQMGQCCGPCVGLVTPEEYRDRVEQAVQVLEGKGDSLLNELKKQMEEAAEEEAFEEAAEIRDQIQSIELVTATQGVQDAGSQKNQDVVALEVPVAGAEGHGVVLQIRGGKLVSVKHLQVQNLDPGAEVAVLLEQFLGQFYSEQTEGSEALPGVSEVLVSEAPAEMSLLEQTWGFTIRLPETDGEQRLLQVARTNARHGLEQAARRAKDHGVQALDEIMEKLHLSRLPQRIECFDISNTQGEDSVASRVVFVDGAPEKELYRRYKIRTVEGANDFASMREVLGRRFEGDPVMPDLVVVDGGKGQLAQAVAILEELGVQGVAVVGLAKARTESDFQSSEVKSSQERIFIPNRKNPVALLPHTAAYRLLTHIRDEAHRFAITYHRKLRDKRSLGGGDR